MNRQIRNDTDGTIVSILEKGRTMGEGYETKPFIIKMYYDNDKKS